MSGDADIGRDAAPWVPSGRGPWARSDRWGTGRRPGGPCRVERVSAPLIGVWIDHLHVAPHLRATDDRTSFMNRSKTASLSFGPGAPSGWYWWVRIGRRSWARPSTDPSFRFRDDTAKPESEGIEASSTWNSWF